MRECVCARAPASVRDLREISAGASSASIAFAWHAGFLGFHAFTSHHTIHVRFTTRITSHRLISAAPSTCSFELLLRAFAGAAGCADRPRESVDCPAESCFAQVLEGAAF